MGLRELEIERQMATSTHNLLSDFFIPAMNQSTEYDRATGYFSSALWAIAPVAFADFFSRGGHIRLLCSPRLAPDEKRAILDTEPGLEADFAQTVADLKKLNEGGLNRRADLLRVLSSLLAVGAVELRFAQVSNTSNLFHDKVGIFRDPRGDEVSFVGSANESASAWSGFGNHEQIEIFLGWSSDGEATRIAGHKNYFDELWSGRRTGVKVTSSRESAEVIFHVAPPEPVEQILREFRTKASLESQRYSGFKKIRLRHYQAEALQNWKANRYRGVISFATGGGKTLTALEAIDDWTKTRGPAVIFLPSAILLQQWEEEFNSWLPDVLIQKVGAGTPKNVWKRRLYAFSEPGLANQRVILATYQSGKTADFLQAICDGEHLLVVGDEVHTFGAPDTRVIGTRLTAGGRLGLSATPERAADEEGTAAIFEFFGPVLEPRYTIDNALSDGVLCEYEYRFEECPLNEEETANWEALSSQLSQELARNKGKMTDRAKRIAIKRARISKSALSKNLVAARIIRDNIREGDRWLVYCESIAHLQRVKQTISELAPDVFSMEYHSRNSREHAEILRFFSQRGGVILAVKCLDEGVDIPSTNKAIVMSSSTNYREYVQRRGRVLRTADGKSHAEIWDLLTVDQAGNPITKGEVRRAREFAKSATNLAADYKLGVLESRAKAEIADEFEDV